MSRSRMSVVVFSLALISTLGAGFAGASETEGLPAAEWLIATVDDTREVGYNVSVAVDPETGHTYISYYDGDYGDLWLAWTGTPVGNCGPNNTWECRIVDSDGIVGKYNSIAVGGPAGPFANIFITYYDVLNGSLKVFEGEVNRGTGEVTGGTYVISEGDPGSNTFFGTETSVGLSGSGTPHIAYQMEAFGEDGVMYAFRVSPGTGNCGHGNAAGYWQCIIVESKDGIGDFIDIDVGAGEVPSIAFSTAHEAHPYPMIATLGGTGTLCDANNGWSCTKIRPDDIYDDTGDYLSFEIPTGGEKHLAYRNSTQGSLEWAKFVGPFNGNCGPGDDSYQCEWIDGIGPGTSPAGIDMKIDSDGNPIIAYQDLESGSEDLKIARPTGGLGWPAAANCGPLNPVYLPTWFCETLEEGSVASSYAYGGLSIALNTNDEAAVAYREYYFDSATYSGRLKIALESISIFLDGFESGNTTRWSEVVP